jgi:MYXO-CTERM domain-containing protein
MTAALLLALLAARAQDYSFPAGDSDYGNFYVTAYFDHHGVDWSCGSYQYSGHRGNDYGVGSWTGMDAGRDLVAAADGTVVATNDGEYDRCDSGDCSGGGGYGNYVKIQHDDGKATYYAHMRQWTVAVTTGERVRCGAYLGQVGSSGYSTGPHLHFEVREASGSQSDPFDGDCSFPPSYWVAQGSYMGKPGLACESAEACEPVATLRCGDVVQASNNGGAATDRHSYYGCSEWSYTGPELVYAFSTGLDEPVSISLTGHSADLDLYVLGSTACDGSDCLAYSDNSDAEAESLSFQASAGHSYIVTVDGWEDAVSSFELAVDCEGAAGPTDSDAPDDSDPFTPQDSEAPDSEPEQGWPPGSRNNELGQGGCGCGAGARGGGWGLLAMVGLLGIRRRTRRG